MNKEERKAYNREWYLFNRAYRAGYNHDRYLKFGTKDYHANREEICAQRREKIQCEYCDRTVTRGALSAHHKTLVCTASRPPIPFTINFD